MLFVEVVNSVEEENGKRNVEYAGKNRKVVFLFTLIRQCILMILSGQPG